MTAHHCRAVETWARRLGRNVSRKGTRTEEGVSCASRNDAEMVTRQASAESMGAHNEGCRHKSKPQAASRITDSNGRLARDWLEFAQSALGSGAGGLLCDGRNAYLLATLIIRRPTRISDCVSDRIEEQGREAAIGLLDRDETGDKGRGSGRRRGVGLVAKGRRRR